MSITRYDATAYQKIAQKLSQIDTAQFDRFSRELTGYIQSNQRSRNEEIQKKVASARKLLTLVGENGILRKLKEDMGVVAQQLETRMNATQGDRIDIEGIDEFSAFRTLSEIMDPPEGGRGMDAELTEFLEADDFSAYRNNSPLKNLSGVLADCRYARQSHKIIESRVEIIRFQDRLIGPLAPYDKAKEDFDNEAGPAYLAFGGNFDLADIEQKISEKTRQIENIDKRIDLAYEEFFAEKQERERVKKETEDLRKEFQIVKKEGTAEFERINTEEAIREKETRKNETAKAFDIMVELHHDLRLVAGADWPTVRANEAKKRLQDAEAKKARLDNEFDPYLLADKLVSKDKKDRENIKSSLVEFFNNRIASKKEEMAWRKTGSLVSAVVRSMKNNEDAMKMLFAPTKEEFVDAYRAYQEKDMQGASDAFELINNIRTSCPDPSVFRIDGPDVDQKIKTLTGILEKKQKEAMMGRYKNSLYNVLAEYERTEEDLIKATQKIEKMDENAKEFGDLQKQLMDLTKHKSELNQIFGQFGLEGAEELKQMKKLADRHFAGEAAEYEKARTEYENALKEDAMRTQQLGKAKWCYERLKDNPFFQKEKCYEVLTKHLFSDKADDSRLEADPNFGESKEDAIEQIEKDHSAKANQYLARAKEIKNKIDANDRFLETTGYQSHNHLADVCNQKEIAVEALEKLNQQKETVKALQQDYLAKDKLRDKAFKAKEAYDRLDQKAGEKAYRTMYEQIEAFRRDYQKDWKASYRRDPNKNSRFYVAIQTALDGFGTFDEFKQMSEEQIREKINNLKNAATTYTREKLSQKGHWNPSSQRRYRLDYAARIENFCTKQTEQILKDMQVKYNPLLHSTKTAMQELTQEKFDQLDPNGVVEYLSRNTLEKQNQLEAIKAMKLEIEKKTLKIAEDVKKKGDKITDQELINASVAVSLADTMAGKLNDYDTLKSLMAKDGFQSVKKWVKKNLDNLEGAAAEKAAELMNDPHYKKGYQMQVQYIRMNDKLKTMDVHDLKTVFERAFFTTNAILKNAADMKKRYAAWNEAQKKAEQKKDVQAGDKNGKKEPEKKVVK